MKRFLESISQKSLVLSWLFYPKTVMKEKYSFPLDFEKYGKDTKFLETLLK